MNQDIQNILEENEKVLWSGKPDLKSLLVFSLFFTAIGIAIIALILLNLDSETIQCTTNGVKKVGFECARVTYIICGVLFFISCLIPILSYLFYKVTDYLVTNKRIIIKTGFIGADMRSIYYDQVRSAFVNVGLVGKLFGTGTILIDTGRITQSRKRGSKTAYDSFRFIKNPYQVYKFVQKGLSSRKEGMHSGRADFESNLEGYKDFVQETEKMKRDID